MYKIKKIKILSFAYTIALIYFIFGLLLGILLAVLKSNPLISSFVNQDLAGLSFRQIMLLYPVSYSVGGFVIGIIIGLIYNQVAKLTGGISIQLVKDKKDKIDKIDLKVKK